jgi:ankyrin repeat protein
MLLLAQDDINVNSRDKYGQSPLWHATENGNLEATKLLLGQDDIDVNSRDVYGQSLLGHAAANGNLEATKLPEYDIRGDSGSANHKLQTSNRKPVADNS